MDMREERVAFGSKVVLQDIAPFLLQAFHLIAGDGAYRAMTWEEVLAERLWLRAESVQVFGSLILIATSTIQVVHQDILISVIELEYSRTFHHRFTIGVGIDILEVFLPRTFQVLGGSLLDAILYLLALGVFGVALIK